MYILKLIYSLFSYFSEPLTPLPQKPGFDSCDGGDAGDVPWASLGCCGCLPPLFYPQPMIPRCPLFPSVHSVGDDDVDVPGASVISYVMNRPGISNE